MQTTFWGLEKNKYPSNMGKAWKDDEVIQLLTSIRNKKSATEIANEHQRTIGSITSKLRGLAVDYYVNDKKSIDEIMKLTGLEKNAIIDAINKREYALKRKEKIMILDEEQKKEPSVISIKEDSVVKLLKDMNERLIRLETKVDSLHEKINKPKLLIKKTVVNEPLEFID